MFDKDGNYAPPDQSTRHVAVTTEAFVTKGAAGVHSFPVAAGVVTWVGMLGQTQIAHIGPPMPRFGGKIVGALIEHETAQVGDVLPASELEPALALARAKQAAVAAAKAARDAAAKPPA